MKKFIALALALTLALSLAACGVQNKIQNAVEGAVKDAISGAEGGIPAASGGDISEEDLDKAWDEMQDWAHEQGWDGEGYHFPQVDSMREWPPAAVWTELGLPDMTPDKMEDGEIYNDGNTHIDGYSDTFVAQCATDKDSFLALAQRLWDAGIKGVDIGGGHIFPAEDIEWLRDDDPNYLWYRAYYEYQGEVMEVYLQYMNDWGDTLWVGVTYSPSDPDFVQYPKISWPAADIKEIIGVELPNPGGTVYGWADLEDYAGVELVIEGVSQSDYEKYAQNLTDGKTPGIMKDEGDLSTDIYGYYSKVFYPENYDEYPALIEMNYIGGVMLLSVWEW